MGAMSAVLKQRVAKILRAKVKRGLKQDIADQIRRDLFDVLNDEDMHGVMSVLLAALMDHEVKQFDKQ